jgi:hypothetical protein
MQAPGMTNEIGIRELSFFITKMENDNKRINTQIRKMKKRIRELETLPKNELMVGKFYLPYTIS